MNNHSAPCTPHATLKKPVLLISASDSSAAAGMQVDLRVLDDLGAPARCAITAVTVQGDGGAKSINPVDPGIILDAIHLALEDLPGIGAVKVGLLGDARTAITLEASLSTLSARGLPIIVDPVMRSTPGSELSAEGSGAAIFEKILPYATLLTPNRDELEVFAGLAGFQGGEEQHKVRKILEKGTGAVLVTGGDTQREYCTDILYRPERQATVIEHPRIGEKAPRGTGCALSSAVAVYVARGLELEEAIHRSIDYVTDLIGRASNVGRQLLLFPGKKQ